MIRYRQKRFAAPLLAGLLSNGGGMMLATTGISMAQGAAQQKESMAQAEEQGKQQEQLMNEQNKQLKKIAAAAKKNPGVAAGVPGVLGQGQYSETSTRVKHFAAVNPGFVKNLTGLGKDLWRTQKGNLGSATKSALTFGALGYAGNRIATSMKDHDTGQDEKNKSFLKKAAVGAGLAAGAVLGAKSGAFGKSAQAWTKNNINVGAVKNIPKKMWNNKIGTAFYGMSVGMPVLSYLGQRKQIKEQARQTEQVQNTDEDQRQYSDDGNSKKSSILKGLAVAGTVAGTVAAGRAGLLGGKTQRFLGKVQAGTGGIMRSSGMKKLGDKVTKGGTDVFQKGLMKKKDMTEAIAKKSADQMFKNASAGSVGRAVSSGASNVGSFMGFYGKGGTEAVQKTANSIGYGPGASGSQWSKAISDWTGKHKVATNLIAAGGMYGVGSQIMKYGDAPFKLVDKHAYDSEKQDNQQIE